MPTQTIMQRATPVICCFVLIAGAAPSHAISKRGVEPSKPANQDAVLVGAGDIASCDDLAGAEATAKLIDKIPGTVFVLGDLAYPNGSDENFAKCYGPT